MITIRIYDDETKQGETISINEVAPGVFDYFVTPIPDDNEYGYSGTLYNFDGDHTKLLGAIVHGRNMS